MAKFLQEDSRKEGWNVYSFSPRNLDEPGKTKAAEKAKLHSSITGKKPIPFIA